MISLGNEERAPTLITKLCFSTVSLGAEIVKLLSKDVGNEKNFSSK